MSESQQGSEAPRDLDETRDDLAQASLALNTAYDRLQDLRTSLRNFSVQRDRLAEHARQGPRIRSAASDTMGPSHSAIVLSDSDEESEIDMDLLREALPARLLELTSRWGTQHARLTAARRSASSNDIEHNIERPSPLGTTEQRPVYPPLRRRRALPPAGSSRDGGTTPPGPTAPARRSILEAHLRQFRHASNPGEAATTLGRRVAQRAAAVAQGPSTGTEGSARTSVVPSETVVHSTLPSGIEPRPHTSGLESRTASHLRYSLLPNPPGVRMSSGSRTSVTAGGAHPRFSERVEHRPRTARRNSFTSMVHDLPSTSDATSTLDASTQTPLSVRLGQLRTAVNLSDDDASVRPNVPAELGDSASGSYRIRRRINGQGEEHVFSINWGELMAEADRDEGLSDPNVWLRPPQPPRTSRVRTGRSHSVSYSAHEPETDDTVVQDYVPFFIREGREGSVQRRRGWARLNIDGDEISTEDEATLERTRAESRIPRTRNWTRNESFWGESSVAVLDFVHRNSRDATTGHRESHTLDGVNGEASQPDENSRRVINSIFRPVDASSTYISPLPVTFPDKGQQHTKEVRVILNGRIVGR